MYDSTIAEADSLLKYVDVNGRQRKADHPHAPSCKQSVSQVTEDFRNVPISDDRRWSAGGVVACLLFLSKLFVFV